MAPKDWGRGGAGGAGSKTKYRPCEARKSYPNPETTKALAFLKTKIRIPGRLPGN